MTKMTALTTLLLTTFSLGLGACVSEESSDDELEHVVFDGLEVAEIVAENPEATFFVDLGVGKVVHFDQAEESLDFSRFLVQCPSMAGPVPMDSWMRMMDLDETDSYWNLRSDLTASDEEFRAVADGPWGDCYEVCDSEGKDCVERCN